MEMDQTVGLSIFLRPKRLVPAMAIATVEQVFVAAAARESCRLPIA
jgi:hypothetical protein